MNSEQWKASGRASSHNGHEFFYRLDGSGPPLLLLHGYPTSSYDFIAVYPALTQRFLTVAPDFLGFGFSAKPREYAYSIVDQAALVEDLLAELSISRVHILAHDYGVSVAQELLAREQDRGIARKKNGLQIETVCFLNGGIFPEAHRPRLIQKLLLSPLGRFISPLITEPMFRKAFLEILGPQKPDDALLHEIFEIIRYNDGHTISHKLMEYVPERKANRERWVNALMKTRARLRFINGSLDPVSGRHMADVYSQLIQNPDVVHLPEAGHYPQMEVPARVIEEFLNFIDKKSEEDE